MKKILWIVALLASFVGFEPLALATTNTVYVTAAGTGTASGVDCSNTKPVSYFNTSGNWSATPTGVQIGPGTTVHITGTFTGSLNGTEFTFQGSGASGNPVTVLADSCGSAVDLTSTVWGSTFNTNGFSHIVIDGAGTGDAGAIPSTFTPSGVIENTANGTSLANQNATKAVLIPSGTDITIRNWYVHNLYVRSGHLTETYDETTAACVYGGTVSPPNQVVITNNQMTGAGWCLQNVGASDQITVSHNDISLMEHTASLSPTVLYFFNNHLHDWGNWDSHLTCQGGSNAGTSCTTNGTCNSNICGYSYHHDGLHCFAGSGGQTQTLYYYNNQTDGATDDGTTNEGQFNQALFMEGAGSATTCMLPGGTAYVFNNVCLLTSDAPGCNLDTGNSTTGNTGDYVVNNTNVGNSPSNTSVSGNNVEDSASSTMVNNAYSGFGAEVNSTGGVAPLSKLDYNYYANCSTFNCFDVGGVADTGSFTTWQAASCTGSANTCDQHGGANLSSTSYLVLDSGCVVGSVGDPCKPQTGSPLINGGTNLHSVCNGQPNPGLGALCLDKNGVTRPTSAAWDAGALQFSSSPPTVSTPTFSPVAGSYGSTQSVTISTSTGGATLCYTTDGSTPTANGAGTCTHGTTYTTAVSVSTSLTLKAVGSLSGDTDSAVGSAAYTIAAAAATPTFSPVAGTYTGTQSVTISTSTGSATLCYTVDGTTPTANGAGTCTHGTTYSGAVSVAASETLMAIASKSGNSDSAVGSAAYVIVVTTPTFSPAAGTYTGTQAVTIITTTVGDTICYTIDSSTPTGNGAGTCTHGATYGGPVSVTASLTLKAIGTLSGLNDSAVGSAAYTITGGTTCGPPNYACPGRAIVNDNCLMQIPGGGSSGAGCPPTDAALPNLNNGNSTCTQGGTTGSGGCSDVDPQYGNILMTRCTDGQLNGLITTGTFLNRPYYIGDGTSGDVNEFTTDSSLMAIYDSGNRFLVESIDTSAHTCYPVLSGGTPWTAGGATEFSALTKGHIAVYFPPLAFTINWYQINCTSPGHSGGCSAPTGPTPVVDFAQVFPGVTSTPWAASTSYAYGQYVTAYLTNSQNSTVTAASCASNVITYTISPGLTTLVAGSLINVTGLSTYNGTALLMATANGPGTTVTVNTTCTNGSVTGSGTVTEGSNVLFQFCGNGGTCNGTSTSHTSGGGSAPSWNVGAGLNTTDNSITWMNSGTTSFTQIGGGWATVGGVSTDETQFSAGMSNNNFDANQQGALSVNMQGSQNTGFLTYTYDSTAASGAGTYYEYNTMSGIIKSFACTTGSGYACPRNTPVTVGQVNVTSSVPCGSVPCQYYLHNIKGLKDGGWSEITPEFCSSQTSGPGNCNTTSKFLWQKGTTTVNMDVVTNAGHETERFSHVANFPGNSTNTGVIRTVTAIGTIANIWAGANVGQLDGHWGWWYLNGSVNDSTTTPIGGTTFNTVQFPYNTPYQNEVLVIPTCGVPSPVVMPACSGSELQYQQVARMGHTFCTGTNNLQAPFACIGAYSQDGTLIGVTTDYACQFTAVTTGSTPLCGFPWSASFAYNNSEIIPNVGSQNVGGFAYTETGACLSGGTTPALFNQTLGGSTSDGTCNWITGAKGNARSDVVLYWLNTGGATPPPTNSPSAPSLGMFAVTQDYRPFPVWWLNN